MDKSNKTKIKIGKDETAKTYLTFKNYERKKTFLVSENYIMWGFRYALGRRTGAVGDVVATLKRSWIDLEPTTQEQIVSEIETAIQQDRAGWSCDVDKWKEIIKLHNGMQALISDLNGTVDSVKELKN